MNEWKECKLGDIYDFSSGLSKSREEFGFGHDFLSFKDVFNNYFLPKKLSEQVNSTIKEQERCSILRGDVFLTRTSETQEDLGMSSVALKDYPKATFNGFTKRLRPKNKNSVLPEFAGFYFRSQRFRAEVTSMASITTRASLNNSMLSDLPIILPPLSEQFVIASALLSFNNKIYLLHRQNHTLEAMAETLFREWLEEEADGHWEKIKFGDVIDTISGYNHKNNEITQTGDYLLSMGSIIKAFGISKAATRHINADNINDKYLCNTGDIVITTRDVTQNADLLGSPGIIPSYFKGMKVIAGSNLYRLKIKNNKLDRIILYQILKSTNYREYVKKVASGTSVLMLKKSDLDEYILKVPPIDNISLHFNSIKLINAKLDFNYKDAIFLENLRDTLLPKLMSGKVRVEVKSGK